MRPDISLKSLGCRECRRETEQEDWNLSAFVSETSDEPQIFCSQLPTTTSMEAYEANVSARALWKEK